MIPKDIQQSAYWMAEQGNCWTAIERTDNQKSYKLTKKGTGKRKIEYYETHEKAKAVAINFMDSLV